MEDRWFSVDEIAAYLGVSRDTVYSWLNKRDMPVLGKTYDKVS